MGVGPAIGAQLLGKPALQAKRCDLGCKLHDDDRIGEASKRLRAIHAPRDEQEGQACCKPQQEPEKVGASTLGRSEEHTPELQSLMRISYAVFCLKKKNINTKHELINHTT